MAQLNASFVDKDLEKEDELLASDNERNERSGVISKNLNKLNKRIDTGIDPPLNSKQGRNEEKKKNDANPAFNFLQVYPHNRLEDQR